jgi:hypothetical protein
MKHFLYLITPIRLCCVCVFLWLPVVSILQPGFIPWEALAVIVAVCFVLLILDSFLKKEITGGFWLWLWETIILVAALGLGFLIAMDHTHTSHIL